MLKTFELAVDQGEGLVFNGVNVLQSCGEDAPGDVGGFCHAGPFKNGRSKRPTVPTS
jgi:hypothetical protein